MLFGFARLELESECFVPGPVAAAQQLRCLTQASLQGQQGRRSLAEFVKQGGEPGGLGMWVLPAGPSRGPLCGWPS